MNDQELLAQRFEDHRDYLHSVAYRMLGSTGEADDAVQEAWLRLSRSDSDAVDNLRAWLTTVVGRVSLDMLRARKARREEPDESTCEPIVSELTEENPAEEAELADSVGLAMLVVLENLSPAERVAFVLHDMFGVPFSEIGEIAGRTPGRGASARQSGPPAGARVGARRRRRRWRSSGASSTPSWQPPAPATSRRCSSVLDPDVVFRVHTVEGDPRARPPAVGAEQVARQALAGGRRFAPYARPATVNGAPGVIVETPPAAHRRDGLHRQGRPDHRRRPGPRAAARTRIELSRRNPIARSVAGAYP